MKHIFRRIACMAMVCVMLLSLCPTGLAADVRASNRVTVPGDKVLIAQTDYALAKGVTETEVILNNPDGTAQVMGFMQTISPEAQVQIRASYAGYYTEGSTPESRAKKVGNLPFDMMSTTKQAAAYKAATGGNVLIATNADYYNMQTGQPTGYLIMEGNLFQTNCETQDYPHEPFFAMLKDGSYVIRDAGSDTSDVQEAISGPFYLVKDGNIVPDPNNRDLMPRNSVSLKADGTVVLFLADGRQEPYSVGMTLYEQAQFLQAQGCVTSLYLDGGGSATVATTREGTDKLTIRNSPSDGTERVVSSALLVVDTGSPSGEFDHASLTPNNQLYIAGAGVQFEAVGVDTNGYPVDLPSDVSWALADDSFGSIDNGGKFTSNGKCGTVVVNLMRGAIVVGTVSVEVQEPDEFYFQAESLNLPFKTTSDLGLTAKYNDRVIDLAGADIEWKVESLTEGFTADQIGSISDNRFTTVKASQTLAAKITATYNKDDGTSLTDTITVEIGKMPEILFDFENDMRFAEYDWGYSHYNNTWLTEDDELTFYGWSDEAGGLTWKTEKGPFAFDGSYLAGPADKCRYPAGNMFEAAGYNFFTWHADYMKNHASVASRVGAEEGQVRFGDYAMELTYDYTELTPGYKNLNVYLRNAQEYTLPGTPTGLGVWVYAPEGTANYWLWTMVSYYDEISGTYKDSYVHFTTQDGRLTQYNGIYWEGWMYCEADLSHLSQYVSAEHPLLLRNGRPLILVTFIPGGSANENGDKIPMGDFAKGSLYFDNFRVVYGDTVDDLENPVITGVRSGEQEIAADGSTVLTSSDVTLTSNFYDPEGDNATGILKEKTAIYVDGVKQTLTSSTDSAASVTVTLPNGSHSVKTVVSDGFGNVVSDTRYFTVQTASTTYGSLSVTGSGVAEIGKEYTLTLKAEMYTSVKSLNVTLDLTDTFGAPTVTFQNGYTGSYTYEKGVLTINATATAPQGAEVATVTFLVPENLERDSVLSCTAQGSFQSGSAELTFAQPKKEVAVASAYELTADVMVAGATGKIYVTDVNGNGVQNAEIYEITDDGEILIGKTNREGVLVTNRFCQTEGASFTLLARGEKGISFRYSAQTAKAGDGDGTPWNIQLNAGGNADTTQSITWFATPQYANQNAVLNYVTKEAYDSGSYSFRTVYGTSVTTAFTYDNQAAILNTVQVTGLKPGTTYYYRVGDGASAHWSELGTFTTSQAGADTSFFVIGDTQMTGNPEADKESIDILKSIADLINKQDADFGIQTGDFVDVASSFAHWDQVLSVFTESFSDVPVVQVLGNHEYYTNTSGSLARSIFNLPGKDFYSVEYGNVYVAVINCNASLDEATAWLVEDAAASQCQWKILTLHQPPYYTNPLGSSKAYNEKIPAAAEQVGIDFVFSGHDHAYARTQPIFEGQVDEEKGIVYFICGDLGEKSRESGYKIDDNPDFHFAKTTQSYDAVYLMVDATADSFAVTAYDADGTELDSYEKVLETPVCQHNAVYDRTAKTLKCTVCGETLENYTGLATDKATGKDMYFLAGKYKTGWFTLGTDLYHFDSNGLAHKLTVLEDQKTTCGTQGHKTVKCECGEVYTARYAKPAGHDFVPHTDADGSACYKCTFCGLISTINVPFLDVSDKAWYAKDVEYAYQNGYINGTSALTFSPNDFLTREQMVTILWRIAGEPGYENVDKTYFSDVKINAYSTAAINWAYENEIVLGTGDGKFRPRDNVTREQMVTILYRYAAFMEVDTTVGSSTAGSRLADFDTVSRYARDAVIWALNHDIIKGYPGDDDTLVFKPLGNTMRCEFAAVIHRYMSFLESQA